MQIQKDGSLLINNFQEKVGPSYLSEFTNIQCLDVSSVPGVALPNRALFPSGLATDSYVAKTFTVDAGTDVITPASMVLVNYQAVRCTTTGTLPAGLATNTTYYVCASTASTLKLATTLSNAIAGTAIDITSTGSGVHSIVGTQMGKVKKIIQDTSVTTSNFKYYVIDDTGKVWVNYGTVPWVHLPGNASGAGQGIEIWKGYLFTFGDNGVVSTYGPLTDIGGSAAWTSSWQDVTASDAYYAPSVVGQDDLLYFAFANYVYSVEQVTGKTFAPGDATTYSFVNPALDLPTGYRIKTMVELGDRLAIGTWKGTGISIYSFEDKTADIFFWDRSSDSFDLPVQIEENGVNQMITVNGILYAVCGHEGRIYATNGSSASLFARIPASMIGKQQSLNQLWFFPNAIMRHRGRVFFGVGSVSGTSLHPLGVYSLDLETGKICCENLVSTGADGSVDYVQIGALISTGEDDYMCGVYIDNAQPYKGRIDSTSFAIRYYADEGYFETGLASVGSLTDKKTYTNCDVSLSKPLASGESLKIYYRTAYGGTYTLLHTVSYTAYGAIQDINVPCPIVGVMDVQIKVTINGGGSSTCPELKYLRIKP